MKKPGITPGFLFYSLLMWERYQFRHMRSNSGWLLPV